MNHPSQWGGLHGYHQLVSGQEVSRPWIDRTQLYWARKRREETAEADVTTYYEVTLTLPPLWSYPDSKEYQELCKKLCDEVIEEAQVQRNRDGMGMEGVLSQPTFKSRFTKRSTRPLCRTKWIEQGSEQ